MTAQAPVWIQILSAMLTPTIAIAGGVIAWLQWRTAERRRKQDLFEKRWEFFKRARKVYEQGPRAPDGYVYHAEDFQYLAEEATFLFGPDIEALIWSFGGHFGENQTKDMSWYVTPFKKYMVMK
jgi:hypothetical protein